MRRLFLVIIKTREKCEIREKTVFLEFPLNTTKDHDTFYTQLNLNMKEICDYNKEYRNDYR